jgi:glycosyltransferase 2 family protein
MPPAVPGSLGGMAIGAGQEPPGKAGAAAVSLPEPVKGPVLPPRAPPGTNRVRRPADLGFAVFSLVIVSAVLGSIRALPLGSAEVADDVSGWLLHIPRWLSFAAAVAAGVACFVLAIVALVVLVRSQWRDARNAVAAGLAGAAEALIASVIWRAEHGAVEHSVLHGSNPSMFVVDTAFVAFVVGTDLARRSHWSSWWPRSGAALLLTGLAVGTLTPFAVAIVLFGGLLAGWTLRWLLGAASVLPGTADLMSWLTGHGVPVTGLSDSQPSSRARLEGVLADGTRIRVHLSGRDTRGSGLARQLWALARLRPAAAGHVALGSRARLEQLALACALAKQAGVHSPAVLLFGEMPGETLVLATTLPDAGPGAGGVGGDGTVGAASLAGAAALFAQLRRLHDTGIAHHDLRPENLFMSPNDAGFSSLDAAEPAAGELARRLDLVQALATLAGPIGPADAVTALRTGYGPFDQAAVAAVLQPLALAPWGWRAMRAAQGSLNEIRHELLGSGGTVPTAQLVRFRWRTVVSAIALTVAAYLVIGQISGVNVLGTLSRANPGWFAIAVLGSAVTYLAAAENLAAFVPKHLSIWRGFCVQLSTAFVGVAMPPTVGHVAVNARYLHREKVDDDTIAAAVTMSQIVNVVTTVLLLIVFGLLTGSGFSRFKIAPGGDVVIGLAVIAAAIIVLLAVPQTRAKLASSVWPRLRGVWPRLLDAVSHPLRLALSAGANLLLSAAYLVAFIAALRSVGAHPAILAAAVVYLAGNAVGSAAPTPGGLGGVEAVLAAGLTAIGIPAHEAIPAVLIFRVATFWLPIPVGWICYLVLRRRGVL